MYRRYIKNNNSYIKKDGIITAFLITILNSNKKLDRYKILNKNIVKNHIIKFTTKKLSKENNFISLF